MGDAVLGRTTQEKDLGVTFSADMTISEQCWILEWIDDPVSWLLILSIITSEETSCSF